MVNVSIADIILIQLFNTFNTIYTKQYKVLIKISNVQGMERLKVIIYLALIAICVVVTQANGKFITLLFRVTLIQK